VSTPPPPKENNFSALLLEGLDHYRKGRMLEAVRAWEEAYTLEPSNLRAREFLRSALERIHAHMAPPAAPLQAAHPWLPPPATQRQVPTDPARKTAGRLPSNPSQAKVKAKAPPQESPWDDGPSMAIPQDTPPPGAEAEAGGAWTIHQEPMPVPPAEDDELAAWTSGAHELVALNDFSGAMELLAKILARKPQDDEAQKLHALCEENLIQMYESKLGAMDRIPLVLLPPDEIIWLNLDPRAGFVLAQIDGAVSFEDLYAICGLHRLDTARILSQLLEEGVVSAEGAAAAKAKRAAPRG
jgi:tetratricopeptide (TPR) repeat protein